MRICHINLSGEFRGGERQMMTLVRALANTVSQRIVVRRSGCLHRALQAEPSLSADVVPAANSPIAAFRAAKDVEIVHVHDGRGVAVGALRSVFGIPFIATRRIAKAPSEAALTRWSYSRARYIVCVSQAVEGIMNCYGPRLRTCTIHDCLARLPEQDSSAVRAIRERHAGKFLVGQVGQLDDAAKGQAVTIETARRLERLRPDLVFVLIGAGRDENALKAEAHGLSNVVFVGWQADIQNFYAALDALVFPSRSEGLGSSILEAMSFGVPTLAARTGGIPELVQDGRNGLLFPSDDSTALTKHWTRLADDIVLRDTLARGARETAAAFSAERMTAQYLDVYTELLRSSRSATSATLGNRM